MSPLKQAQRLQQAAALIRQHHQIVAFTGAGISTESGIPDLNGIDQILKNHTNLLVTYFVFLIQKKPAPTRLVSTSYTARRSVSQRRYPTEPIKR